MGDIDTTAVSGVEARGYRRGTTAADSWDQYVVPVRDRITSFKGRVTTFVTPGRAGTSQKIFALHNASGSAVIVNVNRVVVDMLSIAAAGRAPTVLPPIIRLNRFTTLPTNGTVITSSKTAFDTAQSSSASVTAWGDSSADNAGAGTSSATTLTITTGGVLAQIYAPRMVVVGTSASTFYEMIDTAEFFVGEPDVTLRALEGICVFLDQTVAAGLPTSDKYIVTCDFEEYTRP